MLLALRGRLTVGRDTVTRVRLATGQRIGLVAGVVLDVLEVVVPESGLVRQAKGVSDVPLVASVYTLDARGEVVQGFAADGAAWIWAAGSGWRVRLAGGEAQTLELGTVFEVADRRWSARAAATASAGVGATLASRTVALSLTVVTRFETVHVHVQGGVSVRIPGIAARIVSELVAYDAPVPWLHVARSIWPDGREFVLRRNGDRHLALLRSRLRQAGIRDDLVRPDGRGNVELFLHPSDSVVDEG